LRGETVAPAVRVGGRVEAAFSGRAALEASRRLLRDERYLIGVERGEGGAEGAAEIRNSRAHLLLWDDADEEDALRGFLHASRLRELLRTERGPAGGRASLLDADLVRDAYRWTRRRAAAGADGRRRERRDDYVDALRDAGWSLDVLFLEARRADGAPVGRLIRAPGGACAR
jgi:hypothetical protein